MGLSQEGQTTFLRSFSDLWLDGRRDEQDIKTYSVRYNKAIGIVKYSCLKRWFILFLYVLLLCKLLITTSYTWALFGSNHLGLTVILSASNGSSCSSKVLKPIFVLKHKYFYSVYVTFTKGNEPLTVMITDRRKRDQSATLHPTRFILHYTALLQGFVQLGGTVCSYI